MITDIQLQNAKVSMEKLLCITEEEHFWIISDCGIGFCETVYRQNPEKCKEQVSSRVFWKWWTFSWNKRNYELLLSLGAISINGHLIKSEFDKEYIQHTFAGMHINAAAKFYPSKILVA